MIIREMPKSLPTKQEFVHDGVKQEQEFSFGQLFAAKKNQSWNVSEFTKPNVQKIPKPFAAKEKLVQYQKVQNADVHEQVNDGKVKPMDDVVDAETVLIPQDGESEPLESEMEEEEVVVAAVPVQLPVENEEMLVAEKLMDWTLFFESLEFIRPVNQEMPTEIQQEILIQLNQLIEEIVIDKEVGIETDGKQIENFIAQVQSLLLQEQKMEAKPKLVEEETMELLPKIIQSSENEKVVDGQKNFSNDQVETPIFVPQKHVPKSASVETLEEAIGGVLKEAGVTLKKVDQQPSFQVVVARVADRVYQMVSKPVAAPVMQQVDQALHASFRILESGHTVKVKLYPERLGELELKLHVEKGSVQAEIKVENQTVKAALESGMADLKQSLSNKGYEAEKIHVNVSSDDHESGKQQQFFNGQSSRREKGNRSYKESNERVEIEDPLRELQEEVLQESLIDYYG